MTEDEIARAIDIAYHIGANTYPIDKMSARELWAYIREERKASRSWRPMCPALADVIDWRIRDCENRLTELLEADAPEDKA